MVLGGERWKKRKGKGKERNETEAEREVGKRKWGERKKLQWQKQREKKAETIIRQGY